MSTSASIYSLALRANLFFADQQRDGTLSAGRSPYINYSGMLQQFVQAYISKQQAKDKPTLGSF